MCFQTIEENNASRIELNLRKKRVHLNNETQPPKFSATSSANHTGNNITIIKEFKSFTLTKDIPNWMW